MPLYRGFKKDDSSPSQPVDPTRRMARPEAAHSSQPEATPTTQSRNPAVESTRRIVRPETAHRPQSKATPTTHQADVNLTAPSPNSAVESTRRIVRPDVAHRPRPEMTPTPHQALATPSSNAPVDPFRHMARPEAAHRDLPETISTTTQYTDANPTASTLSAISELVVGWLVVIDGPGRGEVLPLGYGVNDIGRSAGARLRLDFGDESIAPKNQAAIIYTMRSRRFYLQSVATGTRLNGQIIQESVDLKGGESLQIGQTHLRFVPLCDPTFDWCASS